MDDYGFERLDWGRMAYGDALTRMRERHARRVAGQAGDAIICVEHDPVLTLGRHGQRQNLLASEEELARRGVALYEVERGGDITYHGPGQAVAYVVMNLPERGLGVRAMVDGVLRAVCDTCAELGVDAAPDPERPGAWVKGRKLAAIGMAVTNRVSLHGLALNVNTDLSHFDLINGCGLGALPTSLERELGTKIKVNHVFNRLFLFLARELRGGNKGWT